MTAIIPRPLRDIVTGPFEINKYAKNMRGAQPGSGEAAIYGILGGGAFTLPPAAAMIRAAARTTLAAIGTFALFKLGGSVAVAAILGSLVSLPAVVIASGSALFYQGATAVTAALASGSFATLAFGFASLAGGYISLEYHDILPVGAGEFLIELAAAILKKPLAKAFIQ